MISCPNHYNHDFWSLDELLLIAFLERSHNVVLSRVLWDAGPCIEVCDVMGPCIKVATPIWPPRSRGETNIIIARPCAVYFGVRGLCFVKGGSLNCGHLHCNLEALQQMGRDLLIILPVKVKLRCLA